MNRLAFITRMVMVSVLVAATFAVAQEGPSSGKVSVESKSVALGVGVSWGMASSPSRARLTSSPSTGSAWSTSAWPR